MKTPALNVGASLWPTNLDGVYLCSRAVLAVLKQSHGSIVNIASISGLRASTLRVAYGSEAKIAKTAFLVGA